MKQEDKIKMLEELMNQFEAFPSLRFDIAPEIIQGYKDLLALVKIQREALKNIVGGNLRLCKECRYNEAVARMALEWEGE